MVPTSDGCDGCDGFPDMEMLRFRYIVPRNTRYMRIVGKSISENPSHPSRGLIAKPRPSQSDALKCPVGRPDAGKGDKYFGAV
jgi:hypothetical protein